MTPHHHSKLLLHKTKLLVDGDEGSQLDPSVGAHKVGLEHFLGAKATHPDVQAFQGVTPGSVEAKKALKTWIPQIKEQGQFLDRPLRPGVHTGDGDFDFLRYRVYMQTGNADMAGRVAGKVLQKLLVKGG
jgi:hypothetical protein